MPLVIPPSTLDVLSSIYSDTVIIDDIIEHYQIKNQVKKFLYEHYQFELPLDSDITVSTQSQPIHILQIECQQPYFQMKLNATTGQLTTIDLMPLRTTQVCSHSNCQRQDTSSHTADGIYGCYSFNYFCQDCGQLLAQSVSSVSGVFYDIFDQSWAKRNQIISVEY